MDYTECPYCQATFEPEESSSGDAMFNYDCPDCGAELLIDKMVIIQYTAYCSKGSHIPRPSDRHPGWFTCDRCDMFSHDME